MRLPLARPNEIDVETPCPVSWDKMQGDERVRFCGQCRQNVFDLSTMTGAEARRLIEEKQGRLCVQLYRRRDGTIITADCSEAWRVRVYKRVRRHMAWAASFLAVVFSLGCVAGGLRQDPGYRLRDMAIPDAGKEPKSDPPQPKVGKPETMSPGQSGASGTSS